MLIRERIKSIGRFFASGWRFLGRIPNYASLMVVIGFLAWGISTFKDELKEALFPKPAPAELDTQPTTEKKADPVLPSTPDMLMPVPPERSKSLPMPQLNAVSSDEWIPLAHDGDIIIQGMTISYAIYIKLGDRPPVATLVVDGKQHQVRETGFANVIGANGKSCVLKVKEVTKESLAFNLHCYN